MLIHAEILVNVFIWAISSDPLGERSSYLTRPQGYKTFLYSTQLSTEFILLIIVKMPTIIGILTFISMMNTACERLKARNFFVSPHFSFYEQLKFRAQLSCARKKYYNLGAG